MVATPTAPAAPAVPAVPAAPAAAPAAVEVVPIGRDRARTLLDVDAWAFALDPWTRDAADEQVVVDSMEWDRTYGAVRGGAAAGPARTAGVYSVVSGDVTLVGGPQVPASGLTWVGVHPRDRRRGVLTAMIRHHLADVAARGEVLSMLYAAEAAIYGRFGYGTATRPLTLTVPRGAALRDVAGADDLEVDLEAPDLTRHLPDLRACFDAARAGRPGWLSRGRPELWAERFLDPARQRHGGEPLRLLTVRTAAGELRAYAVLRRHGRWEDHRPEGTVDVREAVALDGAAARTLWGRLTDLDLTSTVRTPQLAADDPLPHLLLDPRAARPRQVDGVWVRLVDVPGALAARRYGTDVDAVLEVTDALLPANAGRWHLVGGPDGARCEPTGASPDLSLDVRELGAAYLGGASLAALAAAGLAGAHEPAALPRLATAFGSPVAPHCGWGF